MDYDTLKIEHEEMKKRFDNTLKLLSNEKDLNSQLEEQITKIGQSLREDTSVYIYYNNNYNYLGN